MRLTEHGVSTTRTPGSFRHETFTRRGRVFYQWDYRATTGVLYSGIARSVDDAKKTAELQSGEAIR